MPSAPASKQQEGPSGGKTLSAVLRAHEYNHDGEGNLAEKHNLALRESCSTKTLLTLCYQPVASGSVCT